MTYCYPKIDTNKVDLYMDIAERIAQESYCERRKVGAIIVDSNMYNILSFGYNGTISGFDNKCELPDGTTNNDITLHAETNALSKLVKVGYSSLNAIMFTTLSPCIQCAQLIIQSGIRFVIYKDEYRDLSGVELLKKSKVGTIQYQKGKSAWVHGGSDYYNTFVNDKDHYSLPNMFHTLSKVNL